LRTNPAIAIIADRRKLKILFVQKVDDFLDLFGVSSRVTINEMHELGSVDASKERMVHTR